MTRHGKPSAAYKDKLDSASQAQMQALSDAAIRAIIEGRKEIPVSFSYLFKWPEGMPKGKKIASQGRTDIRSIPSKKLLDYLFDKGYSNASYNDIALVFTDLNCVAKGIFNFMEDL